MADRTIVYVDGFNLYYGAVRGGAYKWLNLQRFFSLLRPHDNILQIHYFTALVDGPSRLNQEAYLRALGTLPKVNIVLGKFKKSRFAVLTLLAHSPETGFSKSPKKKERT
jgi:hypothetical protein